MELTILKLISVSQDPAQSGPECLQLCHGFQRRQTKPFVSHRQIAAAISGGAASSIYVK
jgi:hypothetical protein